MLDTIIHGGIVITMEEPGVGIIPKGAVGIKEHRIAAVGPENEIMKQFKAHRYVDANGKAVLPGLIDGHTHSHDACVRGLAQDIECWLPQVFRAINCVPQKGNLVGSKLALLELMKCGTTTVVDYCCDMVNLVQNFYDLGLRGHVAEMVNEFPQNYWDIPKGEYFEFDHSKGEVGIANTLKLIENHGKDSNDLITCMIGPQGADMMTKELLMEFKEISRKTGLDIHMHVAQGEREEEQMVLRYGKRAIPYLAEMNFLDQTVHCVHLYSATIKELEYVAQQGCTMTSCVSSIASIEGILPPIVEFKKVGGRAWAMGTDQAPGGTHNNMFNEMRTTALLNKVRLHKPSAYPAYEMLRAATIGNARAFGLDDQIGSLKVGKKADIIVMDLSRPYFHPIYTEPVRNIIPFIAYGANGSEIETVIIDGKFVIDNFKVLTVDEKSILDEADNIPSTVLEEHKMRYEGHLLKQYTDYGLY